MRARLLSAAFAALLLSSSALALTACETDLPEGPPPERTAEAQQTSCDFGPSVPGLDVSYYQGTINWPTVAADGWKFAIARISHSTTFMDPQFQANWSGIQGAGMIRGAYQYFEPTEDPLAQAQIVIDAVGRLGPGDLPVTVDVESNDPVDPSTYAAVLGTWLDAVEEGTGKKPIIYTGRYYWNDNVGTDAYADHLLWLAAYVDGCPTPPSAWPDWNIWQWTSTGTIPGMPQASAVDKNYFQGTEEELAALANGGSFAATLDGVDLPATVLAGETFGVTVTYTNSGGETWDGSTMLGTSVPRDRDSAFASATWISANRAAAVTGSVPPGATYAFELELVAPSAPGAYVENFALVQESVTWFADAGGPADDAVHLAIQVVEGGSASAGAGGSPGDGGASADGDDGDGDDGDGGDGDAPSAAAGVGGEDRGAGGGSASDAATDDGCAVRGSRFGGGVASRSALFVGSMMLGLALSRRRRLRWRGKET